jgi:hypothetical protein
LRLRPAGEGRSRQWSRQNLSTCHD